MASLPPFEDPAGRLDLTAATARIRNICGWHIWPKLEQTFTVNEPGGGPDLFLPTLLVHSVVSCTVNGVALTEDELAGLDWSSAGYLGRGSYQVDNGYVYETAARWPTKRRSVVITIEHGYDEKPHELVELAVALASRASSDPSGRVVTSVTTGGKSESYAVAPYESELPILDPYRIR
jgi:hypothetical protein